MTRLILTAAFAALMGGTAMAQERPLCGPYDVGVKRLKDQFHEVPVATGMAGPRLVIQLFVSPSGTFTIMSVRPDGVACIVAGGDNWEQTAPTEDKGV